VAARSGHSACVTDSITLEIKSVLAFGEGAPPDGTIEGYTPPDPEHFGVSLQIFIGRTSGALADSFDITVCSPSWMAARVAAGEWERFRSGGLRVLPESIAVGTGIWLMRRWDRSELEAALRAVCEAFSPGPDWGSVASRIGRLIPWEFDYKYDAHVNEHYGLPFPDGS
jgi:Immunity protein 8